MNFLFSYGKLYEHKFTNLHEYEAFEMLIYYLLL